MLLYFLSFESLLFLLFSFFSSPQLHSSDVLILASFFFLVLFSKIQVYLSCFLLQLHSSDVLLLVSILLFAFPKFRYTYPGLLIPTSFFCFPFQLHSSDVLILASFLLFSFPVAQFRCIYPSLPSLVFFSSYIVQMYLW